MLDREEFNNNNNDINLDYIKKLIKLNQSIFITGPGGTGKSTLINQMQQDEYFIKNNTVYLAPTGIAAFNIRGYTIHSVFKIDYSSTNISKVINNAYWAITKSQDNLLADCKILVIDEVSMISNYLLDTMNIILQNYLGNSKPFGGLKVIFFGDFLQLQPVISKTGIQQYPAKLDDYNLLIEEDKDEEILCEEDNNNKKLLNNYKLQSIRSCYFSESWAKLNPKIIQLKKLHRFNSSTDQQKEFIRILLKLRKGYYDYNYWNTIKNNINKKEAITLTSKKDEASSINYINLQKLPGKTIQLRLKYSSPVTKDNITSISQFDYLNIKKNCKIILNQNLDIKNGLYNGSQGTILDLYIEDKNKNKLSVFDEKVSHSDISVDISKELRLKILFYNNMTVDLQPTSYNITKKRVNIDSETKEKKLEVNVYHVYYFPILLAYAITIHRSQGMTLNNVELVGKNIFAPGQLYVALSRVRNVNNLSIQSLPGIINKFPQELLNIYTN